MAENCIGNWNKVIQDTFVKYIWIAGSFIFVIYLEDHVLNPIEYLDPRDASCPPAVLHVHVNHSYIMYKYLQGVRSG